MSTATGSSLLQRQPELLGQTVVVIGGSAGIGLETARQAVRGRVCPRRPNPEGLERAASELGALDSAAFDATDSRILSGSSRPASPDRPRSSHRSRPLLWEVDRLDFEKARRDLEAHLFLLMQVARMASKKVRAGGTLLFIGGTACGVTAPGMALSAL